MCKKISKQAIRFVICLILMSYYALPLVCPVSNADLPNGQPYAYAAESSDASTPAKEHNPVSHIILQKKRLILRNIDNDSFLKIFSCTTDFSDLSHVSLIFAFEN